MTDIPIPKRSTHEIALRPQLAPTLSPPHQREEAGELQRRIHVASVEELRDLIQLELPNFDEHHAVSSLERLASVHVDVMDESSDRLFKALLQRLHSGEMETSTLARLGAAAVSFSQGEVVNAVSARATEQAAEFGNRELVILARAMALAGEEGAVAALVNGAAPRAAALGARALVRLAWASATVRWQNPALDQILEEASLRSDRLRPLAMSNLLWSMASLRNGNPHALRSLLPHVVHRCRDLSPQGLATGLWSLAALRPQGKTVARPGWMEEDAILRMSAQAMRKIEDFSPEDLGALARATAVFASAHTRGGDFLPLAEAVLSEATKDMARLQSLSPRQLQRLLGSMARWRCRDQDSLEQLAGEVKRKASQLNTHEAAAIIWASAALQVSSMLVPVLSARVAELVESHPKADSAFTAVAGLLWAAALPAKAGSVEIGCLSIDPKFLSLLGSFATISAAEAPTYQLSGVAVAGARLRLPTTGILRTVLLEIISRAERSSLEAQDCALAAHGFATLGLGREGMLLEILSRNFLQRAGRPVEGSDTARDWSDMVEASMRSGDGDGVRGHFEVEVMAVYEDSVVVPLLQHLKAIASRQPSLEPSLRSLEHFAATLALPGLGAHVTRQVLQRTALREEVPEETWASARRAVKARLWATSSVRNAWLAYRLSVAFAGESGEDELQEVSEEPGRLVGAGEAGHAEQLPGLLRPLALPGVSAAGRHAEHQAVLAVVRTLRVMEQRLRRAGRRSRAVRAQTAQTDKSLKPPFSGFHVSGMVQIYGFGSAPSLSFLAVLAQLQRHFPSLLLNIDFDDDVARMPKPYPFD